jgi:hypothetical protein
MLKKDNDNNSTIFSHRNSLTKVSFKKCLARASLDWHD